MTDTFFGCKNTEVNTCVMPQSFTSLRCEITSWFHDFMGILHYVNVGHDGKSLLKEAGSFPMFKRFVGDSRPDFGKVHQPKLQGPVPPEQFTEKNTLPQCHAGEDLDATPASFTATATLHHPQLKQILRHHLHESKH